MGQCPLDEGAGDLGPSENQKRSSPGGAKIGNKREEAGHIASDV